jgi:hypothetical protein
MKKRQNNWIILTVNIIIVFFKIRFLFALFDLILVFLSIKIIIKYTLNIKIKCQLFEIVNSEIWTVFFNVSEV